VADNVIANPGAAGATFATASGTWSGDTANVPGTFTIIASGSEGAWTFSTAVGNSGNLAAGVPRVCIATNDVNMAAINTATTHFAESVGATGEVVPTYAQLWGIENGGDMVAPYGTTAAGLQGNNENFVGTFHMAAACYLKYWDGTGWDMVLGNSTDGMLVNLGSNNDVTVTGSVTANAGTNLNTSALALESGGNLAAAATSLGTLDNIVSGSEAQVDVVAALPAGTNNIGDVDVLTVPSDPFGANADGASATGSISAKLRFIASTGIPVTGTVTVGSHAVTNAGTFAVQVDGSALTALQVIDNPVLVDDAAFTPATSSVMMAGFEADESSTDSVDEGDAGAARMTLDRKVIVTPQPHTAGGCSIFRTLDLDETEEDVKTAAGQVYGVFAINTTNAILWLKFYNLTAANTSVGSSTPVMTLGVPGNNDTDGAGFYMSFPVGVAFDTAICVAATTGVADADTGAPGANAMIVHVFYK